MLQIVTGMYFREGANVRKTLHRAVFYTNAFVIPSEPIDFPVGKLLFSTLAHGVSAVTVEVEEQLERNEDIGGLVSTGGAELLDDFAAVMAFALNVSVARSEMRLREMVPPGPGVRITNRSSRILVGAFDPDPFLAPEAFDDAREFMTQLLTLNRRHFEAAMRAIRRVIDATFLVHDDPTMAYTLFVAALESLSQLGAAAEAHDWNRYPGDKAKIIDAALDGLPETDASRVRDAVLEVDQLSLRRQFVAFTRGHIRPSFYREEATKSVLPIRATDLPKALDFAYGLRSKNVHALQTLAPELYMIVDRAETWPLNDIRALALEGLSRLTRHVIRTYVQRAPRDFDKTFNYRAHLPGQVQMRWAPQMWIGRSDAMTRDNASDVLDGFLSLLIDVLADREAAQGVVDMRFALERVENLIQGENAPDVHVPMVALYVLWHTFMHPDIHRPDHESFMARHLNKLDHPSIYAFVVRVLTGHPIEWTTEEVLALTTARRAELARRPDQQLPPRLDAALMLAAASMQRVEDSAQAAELVSDAVEFLPGNPKLIKLETVAGETGMPAIDLFDFVVERGDWSTADTEAKAEHDPAADLKAAAEPGATAVNDDPPRA